MRIVSSSFACLLMAGQIGLAQPAPGQPPAQRTVEVWLECVECRDGELDAVLKLGPSAVALLGPALLDGPPAARLQAYGTYLQRQFADMKAYEKTHPKSAVPYTEDEFVKRETAKYVTLYRVRAALALGDVGGPQAAAILDEALKLPLDSFVLSTVKQARQKIK